MKKAILFPFILFVFSVQVYGQGNTEKAKAYYFSAEEQYNSGDYSKAIEYCQQVEDLLGSTNARVEALRLKSYFDKGDITKAKASLKTFSSLKPDESLSKEVSPYIVKIEEAEKAEKRRQELAAEKAEKEKQKKIDAANRKQKLIQTAIAEGDFDKNGLKKVEYRTNGEDAVGFIDNTGKEVVPIIYPIANYLNQYGDEPCIQVSMRKNGRWVSGLYNTQGEMILPLEYEDPDNWGNGPFDRDGFRLGLLAAYKNGKWGYVNKAGDVVIPFKFDKAFSFRQSQKAYFKGKKNKPTYVYNVAQVWVGDTYYFINTNGSMAYDAYGK